MTQGTTKAAENNTKPRIVISGVNLREGGTLSIMRDCVEYAGKGLAEKYDIVALVHRKELFTTANVLYLEYPASAKNWFFRLYHEYKLFPRLAEELQPELWLSMQDLTPPVRAKRLAVYCHCPAPFYQTNPRSIWLEPTFLIYNLFFEYAYRLNIEKNDFVIVQQEWIRKKFAAMFPVKKTIVAIPSVPTLAAEKIEKHESPFRFFFPSLPRIFKNFEVVCEAAKRLRQSGRSDFEVVITINGNETRYTKYLAKHYGAEPCIRFIGRISREQVYENYAQTDCLLFPSKLETWGMPLSEFRQLNRPILVANLPYARETLEGYPYARFFQPDSAADLAKLMADAIDHQLEFDPPTKVTRDGIITRGWGELFQRLLG